MKIVSENISLHQTTNDDSELAGLIENAEDLFNMSEVRLYPPNVPKELIFRIEKKGELIGDIRLKNMRWYNRKAELSIILKKEFHGKGYGEEAMRSLINYAFEKMNLHRLEAEVLDYNKTSKALVEKLGFVLEGRFREGKYNDGKYWDVLKYGLLSSEYSTK